LKSCPAAFDFGALILKRLPTKINPSNSSEFWWTFSSLEAKLRRSLLVILLVFVREISGCFSRFQILLGSEKRQ
jgi:hypothetical protein